MKTRSIMAVLYTVLATLVLSVSAYPENKPITVINNSVVSKALQNITKTLYHQGLADPKKGSYREIEVVVGSVWGGDGHPIKTHGWVLPTIKGEKRKAVCWNGLVYPVVSIGAPVDVKADMEKEIKNHETAQRKYQTDNPGQFIHSSLLPEGASVSYACVSYMTGQGIGGIKTEYPIPHSDSLPIKAYMLERLGLRNLAIRLLSDWSAEYKYNTDDPVAYEDKVYTHAADDWLWRHYDRAICAHMRGDDQLSLSTAKDLTRIRIAVEAEFAKRKAKKPYDYANGKDENTYFTYLTNLPTLLNDEERRCKSPVVKPFSVKDLKEKDQSKRIGVLIDHLDEAAARQWGQPGSVDPKQDPIVQALIKEGNAAVEPLLICFQNNNRLTRSVSFGRDFHKGRYLVSVRAAAYSALCEILGTREFGEYPEGNAKAEAEHIRAYWEKYGKISEAERWYLILSDDSSTPDQWADSAERIVRPSNESGVNGWFTEKPLKPGEKPSMHGESLRSKKDPTVSELITKRISGSTDKWQQQRLVSALSVWDCSAAIPIIKTLMTNLYSHVSENPINYFHDDASKMSYYAATRIKCGDVDASDEYANWFKTAVPDGIISLPDGVFKPLAENPDSPTVESVVEWFFFDVKSPWAKLSTDDPYQSSGVMSQFIKSDTLRIRAFRKFILAGLDDKRILGVTTLSAGGKSYMTKFNNGNGSGGGTEDSYGIPNSKVDYRVCDSYANSLSRVNGMPAFKVYWPNEKRDEAIAALKVSLHQYGETAK